MTVLDWILEFLWFLSAPAIMLLFYLLVFSIVIVVIVVAVLMLINSMQEKKYQKTLSKFENNLTRMREKYGYEEDLGEDDLFDDFDSYDEDEPQMEECYNCQGTGIEDDEPCPVCGGEGKV